jgi:hypothetical protein
MKYLTGFLLFTIFFSPVQAQLSGPNRYEVGIFGGISNYIGDLAPDPLFKESHPAVGLVFKTNLNGYFSYTINATYGKISGNDSNSATLAHRGLKFESNIYELSGQLEFNFFKFGSSENQGVSRFTPYVFTGLSFFHFDPTADFKGATYHLQKYNTEGQGFAPNAPSPYKLWQFAVPIGAGFKINLSKRFNMLVFAGYRGTFTNYLDDVGGVYPDKSILVAHGGKNGDLSAYFSDPTNTGKTGRERGNPDRYDWYLFTGISLLYIVPGPICPKF